MAFLRRRTPRDGEKDGGPGAEPPPRRILVVDDEPMATELAAYHLRDRGFQVDTVNDPSEVRGRLAREAYDLVILDAMMPGYSGLDLAEDLRGADGRRDLPLILLTAKELSLGDRERCLRLGVTIHRKPFKGAQLYGRICDLLGGGEGARDAWEAGPLR